MKVFVFLAVIVVSTSTSTKDEEWANFKKTYTKVYKSYEEELKRKAIFEETLSFVNDHNAKYDQGLYTFDTAINAMSDWTQEEWKSFLNAWAPDENLKFEPLLTNVNAPTAFDYRDHNCVSSVKDQGSCGSSWAFPVVGAVEGAWAKYSGDLYSLSVQQLMDCGEGGCMGGWSYWGYETIIALGGLMKDSDYPYTAKDGACLYNSDFAVAHISGYAEVASLNAPNMVNTLYANSPLAVFIDASSRSFQSYSSGVYYDPSCSQTTINHGVLVVGYDMSGSSSEQYWIVKNTWGTGWGDRGYINMRMGVNQCNVESYVDYPYV